jgi:hypothetical protein
VITAGLARVLTFLLAPSGRRPSMLWRLLSTGIVWHIGKRPDGETKRQAMMPCILAGFADEPSAALQDDGPGATRE